jgi:DNA helicase IV
VRHTKEFKELKLASHKSGLKYQIEVLNDLMGRSQKLVATAKPDQKEKLESLGNNCQELKNMLEKELEDLDKKLEKL